MMGRKNKIDDSVFKAIHIPIPSNVKNDELLEATRALGACNSYIEQQRLLKTLPQYIKTEQDGAFVANILTIIFLARDLKPLKKTVTRTLLTIPSNISTYALGVHIQLMIETSKYNLSLENEVLEALGECFTLFPPGVEGFASLIDDIFTFVCQIFLKAIDKLYSGGDRIVLSACIYNASKLLVTMMRQCELGEDMLKLCSPLLIAASKVIADDLMPFNTKSNCGNLLIMAAMHSPDNDNERDITLAALINMENGETQNDLLPKLNCTARICIFSGIINSFPAEVLCIQKVDETPVSVYIFQSLFDSASTRTGNPQEILEVSRTVLSLASLLGGMTACEIEMIIKPALEYITTHLDHFIHTVRQDTINLLKSLVTMAWMYELDGDHSLMQHVLTHVGDLLENATTNFKALNIIANITSTVYLLKHFPHIPATLIEYLNTSSCIAQHVCTAYELLMQLHYHEDSTTWLMTWVNPLIPKWDSLMDAHHQKIITTAFKLNKEVLDLLLNEDVIAIESQTSMVLSCISYARRYNLYNTTNFDEFIANFIDRTDYFNLATLENLMYHYEPEIRILALTVIIDCHKTTELFTHWEFNFLANFLQSNIRGDIGYFRPAMIALYKKAFKRFKDGKCVIVRRIKTNTLRLALEQCDDAERTKMLSDELKLYEAYEQSYREFVRTLFNDILTYGLFWVDRSVALELLNVLRDAMSDDIAFFNNLWTQHTVSEVYSVLMDDTYESNIIQATILLLDLPPEKAYYQSKKKLKGMFKDCIEMASSIKPTTTTKASYLFQVLKHSPMAYDVFKTMCDGGGKDAANNTNVSLLLMHFFIKRVQKGLDTAEGNILVAFKNAPVYGFILCMRHFIQTERMDEKYPDLVPKIVNLLVRVAQIGLPIVNAASPEGYVPEDDDCCDEVELSSQKVLVYAWRTIKEISLLLGELSIHHAKPEIEDHICKQISNYFLNLLYEAKHRGAYEQAYVGFSKYCTKLWNGGAKFDKLPVQWLNEVYETIKTNDEKVIATRRSAGLPFLVQALIVTEPSQRNHVSFHQCMETLLKIAEDYSATNERQAMHAMNILHRLYKHNNLRELVTQYVVRGVTISIIRFNHSHFGIRNSSTLMFSALMMRIFGVKRIRDAETNDMSIKNRLPAKVFFMRYPGIYDFILDQLKTYTTNDVNNASLYPILLILSRLYPSKEKIDMLPYLPYIINCFSSNRQNIRELAAHATLSIIPLENHARYINGVLEMIVTKLPENVLHGSLKQIQLLMRSLPVSMRKTDININLLEKSFWIVTLAGLDVSDASSVIYMDFIISFMIKHPKEYRHPLFAELLEILLASFRLERQEADDNNTATISHNPTTTALINFDAMRLALCLHLFVYVNESCDNNQQHLVKSIVNVLLIALRGHEELKMFSLQVIYLILSMKDEKQQEFEKLEYRFVRTLCRRTRVQLRSELTTRLSDCDTFTDLMALEGSSDEKPWVFIVLKCLKYLPGVVPEIRLKLFPGTLGRQTLMAFFIEEARRRDCDTFATILPLINILINEEDRDLDYKYLIWKIVIPYSDPDCDFIERMAVARFLTKNPDLFYNFKAELSVKNIAALWITAIKLLKDPDDAVRKQIAQLAMDLDIDACIRFWTIPEKALNIILSSVENAVPNDEALNIYMYFALHTADNSNPNEENEGEVFDKNEGASIRQLNLVSIRCMEYLKTHLWRLHKDLSYKDRSIHVEEHVLLVATRFLNLLIDNYICDPSQEKYICLFVVHEMIRFMENEPIGSKRFFTELKKISRKGFQNMPEQSAINYHVLDKLLLSPPMLEQP